MKSELFDLLGRKVLESEARPGIYWRRLTMRDGSVVRKRVVIR